MKLLYVGSISASHWQQSSRLLQFFVSWIFSGSVSCLQFIGKAFLLLTNPSKKVWLLLEVFHCKFSDGTRNPLNLIEPAHH